MLVFAVSILADSQQEPTDIPATANGLEVEVKTEKPLYTSGEPIRFTVLLVNRGMSPVYIAKSFLASAGGIAGFSLSVKQIVGPRSAECPLYADRFEADLSRSGKQILEEDFLGLAPGGIVGYTARYQGEERGSLRTDRCVLPVRYQHWNRASGCSQTGRPDHH